MEQEAGAGIRGLGAEWVTRMTEAGLGKAGLGI